MGGSDRKNLYRKSYNAIFNICFLLLPQGREVNNFCINLLREYNCGTCYIEENGDKGFSKRDMQRLWPAVIGVIEKENKHIRIISFLKQNFENINFALDIQPEFMSQIIDYQEGQEPDDAPDAMAGLLREMNRCLSFLGQITGW